MTSPLNPLLYNALVRKFKHVSIANEGESYVSARCPSMYRQGEMDSPPAFAGEYYRVCCPFCGDTRQRLYINHKFNVTGPDGDDHLYLAWCFNEECIDSRETQKKLLDMIYPFGYRARQRQEQIVAVQHEQATALPIPPEIRLPPSVPLCDPIAFAAAEYLQARGFHPEELSNNWGVRYCPTSPYSAPRIFNRIVIPIHSLRIDISLVNNETVLAGWQAREIGDSRGHQPKYLSMKGMKKSHLLYGLPQAVNTQGPVVLTEGVTDVWRLGSHAVAVFGKSLSVRQRSQITTHFHHRPIVVMFDDDARREAIATVNTIIQSRIEWNDPTPVVLGSLPHGVGDLGESTREFAWCAVHSALAGSVVVP